MEISDNLNNYQMYYIISNLLNQFNKFAYIPKYEISDIIDSSSINYEYLLQNKQAGRIIKKMLIVGDIDNSGYINIKDPTIFKLIIKNNYYLKIIKKLSKLYPHAKEYNIYRDYFVINNKKYLLKLSKNIYAYKLLKAKYMNNTNEICWIFASGNTGIIKLLLLEYKNARKENRPDLLDWYELSKNESAGDLLFLEYENSIKENRNPKFYRKLVLQNKDTNKIILSDYCNLNESDILYIGHKRMNEILGILYSTNKSCIKENKLVSAYKFIQSHVFKTNKLQDILDYICNVHIYNKSIKFIEYDEIQKLCKYAEQHNIFKSAEHKKTIEWLFKSIGSVEYLSANKYIFSIIDYKKNIVKMADNLI